MLKLPALQRISFYIIAPFLYLISILPFWILHGISNFLAWLLYRVLGYRKETIKTYLQRIFPEKTSKERARIIRDFYLNLSDVIVETLKSITLSPQAIQKRFKVVNVEALTQYEKQGRSVFIVCGHYSNWEWMASLGLQFQVAECFLIYSPLQNPFFNRFVQRIRKKYNVSLLPRQETIATLHRNEKQGKVGVYGFAMDQSPRLKPKTYWRSFLGIRVPVFTGAERLAKEYNIPLVYAAIKRIKRGYYEVAFHVLEDHPKECPENDVTDRFYETLEQQIKTDPHQYLWSHKRFKHEGKEVSNPK